MGISPLRNDILLVRKKIKNTKHQRDTSMKLFVATFCARKKKLITESQNIKIINLKKTNTKILKKSLPQLKRVKNYPPSKILCSAYSAKYIPPNYLKKQILKMGSKETTSMFQQGRGMN